MRAGQALLVAGGHSRRLLRLGLAAGLLVVTACAPAASAPLPPQPSSVAVRLDEYRFGYDPAVPAGRVIFEVDNEGTIDHQLILVRLPEELPGTLDDQLRSSTRQSAPTFISLPPLVPDQGTTFAADLGPGRYGMVCFLLDPEGTNHALKGMSSEFWVR